MVIPAAGMFKLYKLPIGRAVFGLDEVRQRAATLGQAEIAELARRAGDECRLTLAMELKFKATYHSKYPPEATVADGLVDRCLSGSNSYLDIQRRFFPGEPRGAAAERITQAIFPDGVAAVTHLPYAEEHAHVNAILEQLESDELADAVALLPEFPELVARLRQRNAEYGDLLHAASEAPTSDELGVARQRCRDLVAGTVALIVGLYTLRDPENVTECEHLLEPILRQNEAVRVIRRRRAVPGDIDPETGEQVEVDSELDSTGADEALEPSDVA